jgi:hypothetical protein
MVSSIHVVDRVTGNHGFGTAHGTPVANHYPTLFCRGWYFCPSLPGQASAEESAITHGFCIHVQQTFSQKRTSTSQNISAHQPSTLSLMHRLFEVLDKLKLIVACARYKLRPHTTVDSRFFQCWKITALILKIPSLQQFTKKGLFHHFLQCTIDQSHLIENCNMISC